jgi:hypothetical protein
MNETEGERPPLSVRTGAILDRAEALYLKVLRAVILLIATVLLLYAGWLAISSLYKISRSPEAVVEEPASVAADELIDAQMPAEVNMPSKSEEPSANRAHRNFYRQFASQYYDLYRSKFEPYRQKEDKQLTLGEFDDSFLNTAGRLQAVTKGELDFAQDKADLESLLAVMSDASVKPVTAQRLEKYRTAKKIPVQRQVERTKITYRRGWDSYSTACSNWYESPIGCAVNRPVETTYTDTVTEMKYPKGTQSHTQIFRAFQERYFALLQQRRESNAAKAEGERQSILAGIVDGRLSLMTTLQILGGFLVLMFFFLLIAIERHQRRLAAITTRPWPEDQATA